VPGASLVFAAHVILVFAPVALYAAQAGRCGLLGAVGMVSSVLGTTMVSGVVLGEIAGASGANVEAVLAAGVSGALSVLGGLAFVVGATITCAGFVWLGLALLSRSGTTLRAGGLGGPLSGVFTCR
jgi:hypothetical protein